MRNYIILLAHFPKISPKRFKQIDTTFPSFKVFWKTEFDDIKTHLKWKDDLVHDFLSWRDSLNPAAVAQRLQQEGIRCVTIADDDYPPLLRDIYDPPYCLFVRGDISDLSFPLAVVGTRKCTAYGKQVTHELVSELAGQGVTIVSGLALGIDGIAHSATLRSAGKTIAVLGSGVDDASIYPRAHYQLGTEILSKGGALISEYPPGTEPTTYTFPLRNRIIAGMSLATLVIEAPKKSGSLITASCSMQNGRDVFAVPQNITSGTASGPHSLIRDGAMLVSCAEDILEALNLRDIEQFVASKEIVPDSPTEAKLLEYLTREAQHIDELTRATGLTSQQVNSTLTLMEMKGIVRNLGGMMYVLAR